MDIGIQGQISQYQTQMRKMDGTGGGHGKSGGMRDIMQSLSQEDKMTLKEQMQGLSGEDRKSAIEAMKQINKTSTNKDGYIQDLLNAIKTVGKDEKLNNNVPLYA
jgi:hypothetical protein